jgi:hypothetical protein
VDARLALLLSPGPAGAGPALAVTGSLVGTGLAFGLPDTDPALFAASRLAVDLERISVLPELAASVNAVELSEARLRIVIDEEGRLNLSRLWADGKEDGGETEARAEEPTDTGPPPVSIDRISLRDGQLTVIDRRVDPAFTAVLKDVTLAVRHLGGTNPRSRVELKGTLGDGAPLRIAGWVTPFAQPLSLRLEGSLDGYELTGLRPYPEEYLGYRVRRGQLNAELDYRYDGGQLRGENALVIRRLMLGEKLDDRFRDRIGLALPFALELLERPGGEIRLRVPVGGNLARPEVSFAGIVLDALRNNLVKTLAAPLRLIGSVVTRAGRIGEMRIPPIAFLPGTITPDPDATTRLASVVEVLQAAPRLELEIAGVAAREELDDLARERGEPVTEADLRELARRRAHVVEETLVARGIDGGRLFVADWGRQALVAETPGGARLRILQ